MTPRPLKARYLAFLAELIKDPDRNAGRAYGRVYKQNNPDLAAKSARRVMDRPDVAAELVRMEAAEAANRGITSAEVVREISMLAQADPRGLFEVWRGACRYCHGAGHLYQRTPREHREAWAGYMATSQGRDDPHGLRFDHQGGIGFNQRHRPHPDCPECFGMGEPYEVIKDSRDWTPGAAKLFAGMQRTKDGLKLATRSQDHALKLAAQLHHLLVEREGDEDGDVPPAATVTYAPKDARKK